jgi:hypothetical protein
MHNGGGQERRPEADALDLSKECYADSASEVGSVGAVASLGGSG